MQCSTFHTSRDAEAVALGRELRLGQWGKNREPTNSSRLDSLDLDPAALGQRPPSRGARSNDDPAGANEPLGKRHDMVEIAGAAEQHRPEGLASVDGDGLCTGADHPNLRER